MINLSIIIVTFESEIEINACLSSIKDNFKLINYEIIVIDNNSKDKTVEIIGKSYPDVNLLINKMNLGYSKANNLAASNAKGDYLLFLNPDTTIIRSDVHRMLEFISNNNNIGIIGPKILNNDHVVQLSYGDQPKLMSSFFELFNLGWLFKRNKFGNKIDSHRNNHPINVDWVSGACMLIQKEIFILIKGFDENIFMYSEDVDLCLRLRRGGYLIKYFPSYEIIHLGGRSSCQNKKIAVISSHDSKLYFFNKHYGRVHSFIIRIFLIISSIIKVLYIYIYSNDDNGKEKIKAHRKALIKLLSIKTA